MMDKSLAEIASGGISIRPADETDAGRLAELRYAFRLEMFDAVEPEAPFIERCQGWMQERLRNPSAWRCWVAETDSKLVGNIWAQLIEKIPNPCVEPECHAYITNFYVHDHYRRHGVGSQLLATALEWIHRHGVHAVILWPSEQTREFYSRNGFAVRDDLMEKLIANGRAESNTP